MDCPDCRTQLPDDATFCKVCGRDLRSASKVATAALTPPNEVAPKVTQEQVDTLSNLLQRALGDGFHVERPLGSGGFAVVYLVRDLTLKRHLAVKVLSPDVIVSHTALERFRREAETVAQLSHPNIVPLHFVGQKDDLVYLAMECVTGGSLADRIEREGKLPLDDVVRILSEVASALAHAHKRGVVHRDIKPQNVLLDAESGRSLVADFGIARTAEGSALTASGMMVGTPAYLSPEQVSGGRGDHRSDLYALGVMGYEMLTGIPPFSGPTPTALLLQRIHEPAPAVEKLRPDVTAALRDVIDGCLMPDPEERFQTAADIVRALGGHTPVSGGHRTSTVTLRRLWRRRRRVLVGAGAAVAVVALGVGAWLVARPPSAPAIPVVDPGMVVIPGGLYVIGDDAGPRSARPAHTVTLDSFGLDVHEVTIRDYAVFVDSGRAPAPWSEDPEGAPPDSSVPVTAVLWSEAMNYCAWKHPSGGRLPSEEEWEAAARGPDGRRYPWGSEWSPAAAATEGSQRTAPAPVGSYPAGGSPEGVLDLVGNVYEWTRSPMAAYPGGTATPEFAGRYVIRGGAVNTPDSLAGVTWRLPYPPAVLRRDLWLTGFRCSMPVRRPAGRG